MKLLYRVSEDRLYMGGEELLNNSFVRMLVKESYAEFYIYFVVREGGVCKSRFIVFETMGARARYLFDHMGKGNDVIDALVSPMMN